MQWLFLLAFLPYFLILLRIWSGLRKIQRFSASDDPAVKVSVVVACRNEAGNVGNLLKDLKGQDLQPQNYNLIFVDDNSTDQTSAAIREFAIKNKPGNLELLSSSGYGKKAAISSGVSASPNEMIVTTDADCRAGRSWLGKILSFSARFNPDMIISPVALSSSKGFLGGFQQLEFLGLQGITAGTAVLDNPIMCNGANLAFRKEAYLRNEKNLRNDLASGDDIFLLQSMKKEGARIMWLESPEAIIIASSAESVGKFLKQRKRWISKSGSYNDVFSSILGIVTFVTILVQVFTLAAGFFMPEFWLVYLAAFLIKSIPDYLILYNTASRYNRKQLLKWFLPSQIIYPFYVLAVILYPLKVWKTL